MKIVQCLEDFGLLVQSVTQVIENETKEQREGFLCMLLGTLHARLLKNMLVSNKNRQRLCNQSRQRSSDQTRQRLCS